MHVDAKPRRLSLSIVLDHDETRRTGVSYNFSKKKVYTRG